MTSTPKKIYPNIFTKYRNSIHFGWNVCTLCIKESRRTRKNSKNIGEMGENEKHREGEGERDTKSIKFYELFHFSLFLPFVRLFLFSACLCFSFEMDVHEQCSWIVLWAVVFDAVCFNTFSKSIFSLLLCVYTWAMFVVNTVRRRCACTQCNKSVSAENKLFIRHK